MNDRNEGYTMTSIEFFRKIKESERSVSTAAMKVDVFKSMAERITVSLEGEVVSRTRNVHANEDAFLNLIFLYIFSFSNLSLTFFFLSSL